MQNQHNIERLVRLRQADYQSNQTGIQPQRVTKYMQLGDSCVQITSYHMVKF